MNHDDLDTHDLRRIMRERHDKTMELEEQLAVCKAENQALAEALQACLPNIDDMIADAERKAKSDEDAPWPDPRWLAVAGCFKLQAEHIRSLLGLPQP